MALARRSPLSEFECSLLRSKVFNIIKNKSFSKGKYILASGKQSNYYLDLKPTMFDPEGSDTLSEMILDKLSSTNIDYVGGLALGAVPLVSTVTLLSHRQGRPLPGFFVRKEVKDHGTRKLIEGLSKNETLQGKRVAILDDVTTSGGSAMMAVHAAQESGAIVVLVLSIVDREEGAEELYRQQNIPFESFFRASEFMGS